MLNTQSWCRFGTGCYSGAILEPHFGGMVGGHSDRLGDQTAGGNPALAGQP